MRNRLGGVDRNIPTMTIASSLFGLVRIFSSGNNFQIDGCLGGKVASLIENGSAIHFSSILPIALGHKYVRLPAFPSPPLQRNIFARLLHGIMKRRAVSRGSLLFVFLAAFTVLVLAYRSRFLLGLIWEHGRRDAVFPSEVLSAANEREWNVTVVIPKIIHQTYKTEEIPEHWMAGQQAVKELHPDWEYMVKSFFPFLLLEDEESIRKRLIKSSSGQTTKLTPSSHPTTPPSCQPTTPTTTRSSAPTLSAISFSTTMAASMSI
jgi:hypothetical protein